MLIKEETYNRKIRDKIINLQCSFDKIKTKANAQPLLEYGNTS